MKIIGLFFVHLVAASLSFVCSGFLALWFISAH